MINQPEIHDAQVNSPYMDADGNFSEFAFRDALDSSPFRGSTKVGAIGDIEDTFAAYPDGGVDVTYTTSKVKSTTKDWRGEHDSTEQANVAFPYPVRGSELPPSQLRPVENEVIIREENGWESRTVKDAHLNLQNIHNTQYREQAAKFFAAWANTETLDKWQDREVVYQKGEKGFGSDKLKIKNGITEEWVSIPMAVFKDALMWEKTRKNRKGEIVADSVFIPRPETKEDMNEIVDALNHIRIGGVLPEFGKGLVALNLEDIRKARTAVSPRDQLMSMSGGQMWHNAVIPVDYASTMVK